MLEISVENIAVLESKDLLKQNNRISGTCQSDTGANCQSALLCGLSCAGGVFSGVPGLYLLDACAVVTTNNIQMLPSVAKYSPWGTKSHPSQLRTISLKETIECEGRCQIKKV